MTIKLEQNIAVFCEAHGFTVGQSWSADGWICECGCVINNRDRVQLCQADVVAITEAIKTKKQELATQ